MTKPTQTRAVTSMNRKWIVDLFAVLGDEDDRGESHDCKDDQSGLEALRVGHIRALTGTDISLVVHLTLLRQAASLADQDSADAYSAVSSLELVGTT